MIPISRLPLTLFTLAFGYYHAALGLLSIGEYANPMPIILGITLYFVALSWVMLHRPGLKLPGSAVAFALVTAGVLPLLGSFSIGSNVTTGYTTWYVVGVATLMAVLAVRQSKLVALLGTAIMIIEVLIWGGFQGLIAAGAVGALLILLAALGASAALSAAEKAAATYRDRTLNLDAEREANEAARNIAKVRARQTLDSALPILKLIEQKQGRLNRAEIQQVRMTEAYLRDRIRGKSLISQEMVDAVQSARSRGVEVQLLDDGGFEEISERQKRQITARVSDELSRLASGKVVIRSTSGEDWTLTMVALQPGAEAPDIFLKL